jgi:hypothetical protein
MPCNYILSTLCIHDLNAWILSTWPRGLVRREDGAKPEEHALSLVHFSLEQAMKHAASRANHSSSTIGLIASMAAAQQASV